MFNITTLIHYTAQFGLCILVVAVLDKAALLLWDVVMFTRIKRAERVAVRYFHHPFNK